MKIILQDDNGDLFTRDRLLSSDVGRECVLDKNGLWHDYVIAMELLSKARSKVIKALSVPRLGEIP